MLHFPAYDYSVHLLVHLQSPSVPYVPSAQSVLNTAARVIFHLRSADHITDALATLHWLRILERIKYKITFRVFHGSALPYLGPLVSSWQTVTSFYRHQSSSGATSQAINRP